MKEMEKFPDDFNEEHFKKLREKDKKLKEQIELLNKSRAKIHDDLLKRRNYGTVAFEFPDELEGKYRLEIIRELSERFPSATFGYWDKEYKPLDKGSEIISWRYRIEFNII